MSYKKQFKERGIDFGVLLEDMHPFMAQKTLQQGQDVS